MAGLGGRPGAGKKDSLASGADRLVGLAGRQADRPCWQQAGRPGPGLQDPLAAGWQARAKLAGQGALLKLHIQDIVAWSRSFN